MKQKEFNANEACGANCVNEKNGTDNGNGQDCARVAKTIAEGAGTAMTPEKSLEIITSALAEARTEFSRGAGAPMLIWGASVLLVSGLVMLTLHLTGNLNWHFLWFAIPVIGTPFMLLLKRNEEKRYGRAVNPISSAIGSVWLSFGIFSVVYAILGFFFRIPSTTPIIVLMLGLATSITGGITKTWGVSVLGIIAGIGGLVLYCSEWLQWTDNILCAPIMMAIMSILLLIIPGLIYNHIGAMQESGKSKR